MIQLGKCDFCKHCNDVDYICKAFPNGIPNNIYWDWDTAKCNNEIIFEDKNGYGISKYNVPVDIGMHLIGGGTDNTV